MYKGNAKFCLYYCEIPLVFSVNTVGQSNYDGKPFQYFEYWHYVIFSL